MTLSLLVFGSLQQRWRHRVGPCWVLTTAAAPPSGGILGPYNSGGATESDKFASLQQRWRLQGGQLCLLTTAVAPPRLQFWALTTAVAPPSGTVLHPHNSGGDNVGPLQQRWRHRGRQFWALTTAVAPPRGTILGPYNSVGATEWGILHPYNSGGATEGYNSGLLQQRWRHRVGQFCILTTAVAPPRAPPLL